MFEIFNKTEQLFLNSKPEPLYLLYTTAGESVIDKPDEKYKKLTVVVIAAGGHGGAGGGLVMWGGVGGIGGLVIKVYTGSELANLPQQIPINIGICPAATGATGQNTSFNGEVIAYGGSGGGNGGFGYNGSTGANGSGIGGDVTVGAPVEQRTFNGTTFGSGGGGTQGSGGGYPGLQGCVYIICE